MIIGGDIGGTKTNLALFETGEGSYVPLHLATYHSKDYSSLEAILKEFLAACKPSFDMTQLQGACFAIAGPVVDGVCHTTNLPWIVDTRKISAEFRLAHVYLLNDLEANAWGIDVLAPDKLCTLFPGKGTRKGNRAVVSPGTGLGEAGLFWDGKSYYPFACEGGHADFAPADALQLDLCRYLQRTFGHASYERVLSGPGIHNLYNFLIEEMHRPEPDWLKAALQQDDPTKVISEQALKQSSETCVEALSLFVSILGAEAGNTALKFMAIGGIYLGGGIPPKILPKLKEAIFHNSFVSKGRMRDLLETVPIYVILDDQASLKGATHYCRLQLSKTLHASKTS